MKVILLLGWALSQLSFAQTQGEDLLSFQKGITAYDQGLYQEAISQFEGLLTSDSDQGTILYNLGNAYFKQGQKGEALAAYFAARTLLPRDPELLANIQYIQKRVPDRLKAEVPLPEAMEWLRGVERLTFFEGYLILSLLLGVSFFLASGLLFFPDHRVVLGTATGVGLILCLAQGGLLLVRDRLVVPFGAIKVPQASILAGKSEHATEVFQLLEGAPVRVRQVDQDWFKIELSDGKKGWVPRSKVAFYGPEAG